MCADPALCALIHCLINYWWSCLGQPRMPAKEACISSETCPTTRRRPSPENHQHGRRSHVQPLDESRGDARPPGHANQDLRPAPTTPATSLSSSHSYPPLPPSPRIS
ncbi:hypothetical protein BCR34DRAFT_44337 [Clohesyomyces aquaticus]|uniref:Uncharacterized protein n=1 Tax=Clohesyomyces aquaticus TaxID=1231657 RepID=A0A1Y1Z5J6_9PLEO|nr:hypothetical protein BCR34DRAFT_44337 [Clohesyomyces aquaticus]